ncbi:hypothetical protein HanIR_Chr01g0029301 [Helianthus annuus]|nr:hypothetical protein HanIR_Chr01g0029301 [Helianthus annuus]
MLRSDLVNSASEAVRVDPVNSASQTWSTQLTRSTQSNGSMFRHAKTRQRI